MYICPAINQEMRKSSLIRVLSTEYLHPPHKTFTPLVTLLELEH